tara:strand:- start:1177 stop:1461 length:285 start_codon:yes stop_codon:yes gene_type:complete
MNDLDMILLELEEQIGWHPPPMQPMEAERYFNDAPLHYMEMFRDCDESVKDRIKQDFSDELWEWIEEQLDFIKPIKKEDKYTETLTNVPYEWVS